ncbi:hypothetical protein CYLTODRAFT_410300 [Cylindrobasidium torrendii FP15055 ss-10]|uniref:Uncharacterized protein n=1 Tax=Cylindrobasidium torrendii FP15055 ss-10 TaxID=1314674 RepID=A0A0D7BDE3_9AGAR|nr:hypothetical protein CYLTODRAFT_410300 [Cylindrobasidium torrendii FP15055 ss-10]
MHSLQSIWTFQYGAIQNALRSTGVNSDSHVRRESQRAPTIPGPYSFEPLASSYSHPKGKSIASRWDPLVTSRCNYVPTRGSDHESKFRFERLNHLTLFPLYFHFISESTLASSPAVRTTLTQRWDTYPITGLGMINSTCRILVWAGHSYSYARLAKIRPNRQIRAGLKSWSWESPYGASHGRVNAKTSCGSMLAGIVLIADDDKLKHNTLFTNLEVFPPAGFFAQGPDTSFRIALARGASRSSKLAVVRLDEGQNVKREDFELRTLTCAGFPSGSNLPYMTIPWALFFGSGNVGS